MSRGIGNMYVWKTRHDIQSRFLHDAGRIIAAAKAQHSIYIAKKENVTRHVEMDIMNAPHMETMVIIYVRILEDRHTLYSVR